MPPLTESDFRALKEKLNSAIHEIVFAAHHLENDSLDDASNALMTAQGTLESVAEHITEVTG